MDKVKEKYNDNLKRIEKAFIYFDREDISIEDKEIQLERFTILINQQNDLMQILDLKPGQKEVMEGFE